MALIEPVEFISKDGSQIIIRSAEKADANEVKNAMVEISATSPFILSTPESFRNMIVEEEENFIVRRREKEQALFIIALKDSQIIATAGFEKYGDVKRAHRGSLGISIHHEFRGIGLGTKIMKVILDKVQQFPDVKFVELDVMSLNHPALKMYLNLGFKVLHSTPQAYQLSNGEIADNIMMRLENKK